MRQTNGIPIGIKLFAAVIILFTLYYYHPLYTGEISFSWFLDFTALSALFWFDIILTIILLYAATYGFYKAKNWARLYTIFYLSYSAFWAIVMIAVRWRMIERYFFFVIYVILIMYLSMSWVKDYFRTDSTLRISSKSEGIYCYGDYTLYCKEVLLKSGHMQTIYFFSKATPKAGKSCIKPENYVVGVNEKTGMPYLKKKKR